MKEACEHFNELLNQKKYKKLIHHISLYLYINRGPSFIYCYRAYAKNQIQDETAHHDYSNACKLFDEEKESFDFHKSLKYADGRIIQLWILWRQTYMNEIKINQQKNFSIASRHTFFPNQNLSSQPLLESIDESTEEEYEMSERPEIN